MIRIGKKCLLSILYKPLLLAIILLYGATSKSKAATTCYVCHFGFGLLETERNVRCSNVTTCQSDEMCEVKSYVTTTGMRGAFEYRSGCSPKDTCQMTMQHNLRFHPHPSNPGAQFGRRWIVNDTLCQACCGDHLCNQGRCSTVLDRMLDLWKLGFLDLHTLKQKQ